MSTFAAGIKPFPLVRPKHLLFAILAVMLIYVVVHDESFLVHPKDPLWQHYQPFKWWLLPHGIAGACALLLGPMQFSDRLRDRFRQLHRVVGRIYVAGVFVAAPLGFYIQYFEERMGDPRSFSIAAAANAALWMTTTGIAMVFILKGKLQEHRQWMTRSFAVALVFLEGRVIGGLTGWENLNIHATETIVWACLAFSILSADLVLQWQQLGPSPSVARRQADWDRVVVSAARSEVTLSQTKSFWGGTSIQILAILTLLLFCSVLVYSQQIMATNTNVAVPPLINFSGQLTEVNGKPLSGSVAVTFLLYKEPQGGSPIWMESQNVQPDSQGHYTVMLGVTSGAGLPTNIFVAGEAHWLGVQVQGQEEQPRVLLVSAPYALKAGDAETIGGLPPSAFVLAAPPAGNGASVPASQAAAATTGAPAGPPAGSDVTTTGGTVNAVPLFTTPTNIQNSLLTQSGKAAMNVVGKLNLPALGLATATAGKNSQPQSFVASVFNSTTGTAVPQTFQWQAEPVGNDTSTASGSVNLLYASGTSKPAETGLAIASNGQITFATGQTFPGTGSGTVTSVASGTGLTGGPITSTGTLAIDPTVVPLLAANNTFTGTQTINNTTTMTGTNTAGVLQVTNTVTSGHGPAIVATTNSSAAAGIKGIVTATTGTESGVFGTTSSTTGYGVQGIGPFAGVYGDSNGSSTVGSGHTIDSGVWGDTGGGPDSSAGVLGTAGDNYAGLFANDSGSDTETGGTTLLAQNDSSSAGALVFWAGSLFGSSCTVDTGGNLTCTGKVTAVVPADGGAKKVSLHAMQSPENWFEDFGSSQLVTGAVTVVLDPTFASTVNTSTGYHVFLTPNGDCGGLYVSQKSAGSFEVRELGRGQSSVTFDYRIVAKRAGFENDRLEDVTERYLKMQEQQRHRLQRAASSTN